VTALRVSEGGHRVFSADRAGRVLVWTLVWDWEFPPSPGRDRRALPYLEILGDLYGGKIPPSVEEGLPRLLRRHGFGHLPEEEVRPWLREVSARYAREAHAWIAARYGLA
jgi:hypothetical protein